MDFVGGIDIIGALKISQRLVIPLLFTSYRNNRRKSPCQ